jgi:alpha-L-rhamnosidase
LGGLTSAEASLKTVRGQVRGAWSKDESSFSLEVLVPVGAIARVVVPMLYPDGILMESGKVLWRGLRPPDQVSGITPAGWEDKSAVFEVASGAYRFDLKKAG